MVKHGNSAAAVTVHAKQLQALPDTPLRQAYRGQRPSVTPVWFLGQTVMKQTDDWESLSLEARLDWVLRPENVVSAALKPITDFDVDATLCFPDVLLPLRLAGVDLRTGEGPGGTPLLPIRSGAALDTLLSLPAPDWSRVEEAVHATREALALDRVLLAFGAAPFVLSSLLVEGICPDGQNLQTRIFMQSQPRNWERLMGWCANLTQHFLLAQIGGGAEVVQMVDPWVRTLTEAEYACMAEPYARGVFTKFPDITKISCNLGAAHLLEAIAPYVDVLGIGDNLTLEDAAAHAPNRVLQGNLDTDYLYSDRETLGRVATEVLRYGRAAPAHVFNCSGGLPDDVDHDDVRWLVDFVHNAKIAD